MPSFNVEPTTEFAASGLIAAGRGVSAPAGAGGNRAAIYTSTGSGTSMNRQVSNFIRLVSSKQTNGTFIVSSLMEAKPEMIEGVEDPDNYKQICGCRWSGNMRVLILTGVMFVTITLAQVAGAISANSKALLSDCVSMGVDASTYFMHAAVETQKGKRFHRELELIVSAFSILILLYLQGLVLPDAAANLNASDEDDDVDPWIVLAFAVWGLVFDAILMYAFYRNAVQNGDSNERCSISMLAAFLHVAGDFAVAVTTLIASILIIGYDFNGTRTDAWACLIVGGIIIAGALYGVYEWIVDFIDYLRPQTPAPAEITLTGC